MLRIYHNWKTGSTSGAGFPTLGRAGFTLPFGSRNGGCQHQPEVAHLVGFDLVSVDALLERIGRAVSLLFGFFEREEALSISIVERDGSHGVS